MALRIKTAAHDGFDLKPVNRDEKALSDLLDKEINNNGDAVTYNRGDYVVFPKTEEEVIAQMDTQRVNGGNPAAFINLMAYSTDGTPMQKKFFFGQLNDAYEYDEIPSGSGMFATNGKRIVAGDAQLKALLNRTTTIRERIKQLAGKILVVQNQVPYTAAVRKVSDDGELKVVGLKRTNKNVWTISDEAAE